MAYLLDAPLPIISIISGCTIGLGISIYAQWLDMKLQKAHFKYGLENKTPDYFCIIRKTHLCDLNLAFWCTIEYLVGLTLLMYDYSFLSTWFWISFIKILLTGKLGYSLYNNYKEWCWICVSIFFIDIFLLIACLFPDSL